MQISRRGVLAGILISLAAAGTCAAGTISTATYTVSTTDTSGNPQNATVTFVLNDTAGVYTLGMTVTNTDTLAQIGADPTGITGVRITMPGSVVGPLSISSSSGNLVTIGSNGGVTENGGGVYNAATSVSLTQWSVDTKLVTLPTVSIDIFGTGGATENILPLSQGTSVCPASGGNQGYCSAGPSTRNHSPAVDGAATFTLSSAGGGTDLSTVDLSKLAVQLNFGTNAWGTPTDVVTATYTQTTTPEPGTIGLGLCGLGLLAAGNRRRRA